ncbi:MAG TPA: hypothetical protein VJ841_05090 [Candidatus Saccharimonadales bacterium]|nr:hypothetical protein [Candidatus Saccharimonadales bacterium]
MGLFDKAKGKAQDVAKGMVQGAADGAIDHWLLDKSGRWTVGTYADKYVLEGWTNTQLGRITVHITISKKTGDIVSRDYTASDGSTIQPSDLQRPRELNMNLGGVVLKPVRKGGGFLPMKPKIYNEITP